MCVCSTFFFMKRNNAEVRDACLRRLLSCSFCLKVHGRGRNVGAVAQRHCLVLRHFVRPEQDHRKYEFSEIFVTSLGESREVFSKTSREVLSENYGRKDYPRQTYCCNGLCRNVLTVCDAQTTVHCCDCLFRSAPHYS